MSLDKADANAPITATYTITFPDGATAADLAASTPLTGEVSIPANQTSATITIPTLDDRLGEETETFVVTLSNLSANAKPGDLQATGTILDNEPALSIADAQAAEGLNLAFNVSLDKPDTADVTATYTIAFPDGATAADLLPGTPLTGEVRITAGNTSATIPVPAFDDALIEGAETFTVALSNLSSNVRPGDALAVGTILDNEGLECGYSWGDPHYVTADGLAYDMQGCGEFVLVETSNANDPNPVVVQTRTALYGPNVSVNTAVATLVNGVRVTIDTQDSQPLRIDGQVTSIASGGSLALGGGQISFNSGVYSIDYPNQEHLIVTDRGSYVDVRFCALDGRPDGSLRGLLGNFDSNASNDLATRSGTTLTTNISFTDLYGTFANSWRISQAESLFDYRPGETTATFTEPDCPRSATSLNLVDPNCATEAQRLLDTAGITDPTLRAAATLDYGLTCDPAFIQSVLSIETPQQTAMIIDPLIIWQNGGQVVIGSASAPTTFNVGTNAAVPAGVELDRAHRVEQLERAGQLDREHGAWCDPSCGFRRRRRRRHQRRRPQLRHRGVALYERGRSHHGPQ